MNSNQSRGNPRLPVVFRARVTGLTPSTTYRYFVQGSALQDVGKPKSGAGNPLIIPQNGADFSYYTQPKLSPDSCGTLMTDAAGTYSGWFAFVNTNNVRFRTDTLIRPSITLNDGMAGRIIDKRFSLDQTIRTIRHSDTLGAKYGTGIYGTSYASPKNYVALYADQAGSGRPVAVTYVESENVSIASIASWYSSNVNGVNGRWGTIIPNTADGIRNITVFDQNGVALSDATSTDGAWGSVNTVSPNGGISSPLIIPVTAAPLTARDRMNIKPEIYPNPAKADSPIMINSTLRIPFSVLNLNGEVVRAGILETKGNQIQLPSGFYLLKTGNGIQETDCSITILVIKKASDQQD